MLRQLCLLPAMHTIAFRDASVLAKAYKVSSPSRAVSDYLTILDPHHVASDQKLMSNA
jgi:hypothetical protein